MEKINISAYHMQRIADLYNESKKDSNIFKKIDHHIYHMADIGKYSYSFDMNTCQFTKEEVGSVYKHYTENNFDVKINPIKVNNMIRRYYVTISWEEIFKASMERELIEFIYVKLPGYIQDKIDKNENRYILMSNKHKSLHVKEMILRMMGLRFPNLLITAVKINPEELEDSSEDSKSDNDVVEIKWEVLDKVFTFDRHKTFLLQKEIQELIDNAIEYGNDNIKLYIYASSKDQEKFYDLMESISDNNYDTFKGRQVRLSDDQFDNNLHEVIMDWGREDKENGEY